MNISMSLTEASISAAIAQLEAYRDTLPQKAASIRSELSALGEEEARAQLASMPLQRPTGELAGSITHEDGAGFSRVVAASKHASYVEFGTGVVGAASPHPGASGWSYDVNGHGQKGWAFPVEGGGFLQTRGQPSHPFMFFAAQKMHESVPDVGKRVFG